jgi:organic hydroperoxide reductase OsmC/OhrA
MGHYHEATVSWRAGEGETIASRRYSRAHRWRFDGGIEVRASASPHVVPLPWSAEDAVDPEEALVAALASCHMLSFIHLAAHEKLDIAAYEDRAVGELAERADGRIAMVSATLHPRVEFRGRADPALVDDLHHRAHELCYVANSVNFPVTVEPAT